MPPIRFIPPIAPGAEGGRHRRYDPPAPYPRRYYTTYASTAQDPTPGRTSHTRTLANKQAGQPPHTRPSSHELQILSVISHGLAKRTTDNYSAAANQFKIFCTDNQYTALPAQEFALCAFAAHLATTKASSSIANLISGIRSWHIANGMPWNGGPRLQMVLKGAHNLTPDSSHLPQRAPVTTRMIELLHDGLDGNNAEDRAILAAATIAFWGQCRLGEILGTSSRSFDPKVLPSRAQLGPPISSRGSRILRLPRTKTNQATGEQITIAAQAHRVDPIRALERHLHIGPQPGPTDQLFAYIHDKSGHCKILTRERFLSKCNTVWSAAGLEKFSGHAFRIGGTSHLLHSGVDPDVVKSMGRWSSDAFHRYWRDQHNISIQHAESLHKSNRHPATRPNDAFATSHARSRAHARRQGGRP